MKDREYVAINEMKIQKDKVIRWVILLLMIGASTISIMIDPIAYVPGNSLEKNIFNITILLRDELQSVELAHVLAVVGAAVVFDRELFRKDKPFCAAAFVVGAMLSFFLVLGMSFSVFHSFEFFGKSVCQRVIVGVVFIGLWNIMYVLLKWLYRKLDSLQVKKYTYIGVFRWFDEHCIFCCMCIMLICWLLLGFSYFPGSVPHDGRNQLNMVFGISEWKIHHPLFSTIILKLVYGIGYDLFGVIGGCVFFVIFQSVIASIVFSMICDYVRVKSKNLIPTIVCLVYFSIAPMWWTYMQTVAKDTIYTVLFALFVLEYIKIFLDDAKKGDYILSVISSVCVCVLRNGGHYIVIPALLVLVISKVHKRKEVLKLFVSVICMHVMLNIVLINILGLTSVNQVEALSIPLQQIARYVTFHEDELTTEERNIIDRVVKYDGIPERYNPEISDYIKNYYRSTSEEEWGKFWDLWFEKLKERPSLYITATMNHIFGYIDPFYFNNQMQVYQLYNKESLSGADSEMIYSRYVFDENIRSVSSAMAYLWQDIPLLSFVVNPAFYTWIGIISIGALIRKRKWKNIIPFIIPFINVLICFASPVNGFLRYMLPVMSTIPLYILLVFVSCLEKKGFTI